MSAGQTKRIVVVGASLGGLRAAEQIYAAGWQGEVHVIGEEEHKPYNRPPLSKELLANPGSSLPDCEESTALRRRATVEQAHWRLGDRVVASDLGQQNVMLESGETVAYDGLVVATGVRPHRISAPGPSAGRHTLRSLSDAHALASALEPGKSVLVIGAGFIGCEVAATAQTLGCKVTLIEGSRGPMHRAVGEHVSKSLREWLRAEGLTVVTDTQVVEFLAENVDAGAVARGVRLMDGSTFEADVIVEAVGSVPNTEWLEGNSLDLTDGVLVDSNMRLLGIKNAVAVGDVARFPDPWSGGELRRIEHWQHAIDTARTAAKTLVADLTDTEVPGPFDAMPSFWSDQFGRRIQGVGAPHRAERCAVLEGTLDHAGDGIAIGYHRGDQLVGVVTIGLPAGKLVAYRKELSAQRS